MTTNLFETQYDVTRKSKIKRFYESNKISIFSAILIIIIFLVGLSFYFDFKEKQRIELSENYIKAKIYLEEGNKSEALNLLKKIVYSNDPTYSVLCFFLIINQDLITDHNELSLLFDYLLENNKFDVEIKNLLIFKKAIFDANFLSEIELLNLVNPLINQDALWKPHIFLLLGDYFVSKKEYVKAKDFYAKILTLENLSNEFYNQARIQISLIAND